MDDKLPGSSAKIGSSGSSDPGQQPVTVRVDQPQTQTVPLPTQEPKEAVSPLAKETGPITFTEHKEFTPPPEVKEWISEEKKEETTLPEPVKDEYDQILVEAARPAPTRIVLPLDEDQMKTGFGKKVTDSIKWLVTWCIRIIKMFPARVTYPKETK